jgi:hypothetical protein
MSCPCDSRIFPPRLTIVPGLSWLPRQLATLPEFRAALLQQVRSHKALNHWKADVSTDLGMMLLEMGAYVFDAVAFYDEVIANECYVRTARLPASLHSLVAQLGYVPRPATGSTVLLAAWADGRLPVTVPRRTAFRSGAVAGGPPQVFELVADATIHPLNNQWTAARTRPTTLGGPTSTLLLVPRSARVRAADVLLISTAGLPGVTVSVSAVAPQTGIAGDVYIAATLAAPVPFTAGTALNGVSLLKPTRRAAFWNLTLQSGDSQPVDIPTDGSASSLVLDRVNHAIRVGDTVLVGVGSDYRCFTVSSAADIQMHLPPPAATSVTSGGTTTTITPPPVPVPATQLTLDANLNEPGRRAAGSADWTGTNSGGSAAEFILYFGMQSAGTLTLDVDPLLAPASSVALRGPIATPFAQQIPPAQFVLSDINTQAVALTGSIDYPHALLAVDGGAGWSASLTAPVSVFGNILTATRGQSVLNEVLGNGDGSIANQSFTLKKSPLTYFPTPSATTAHGFTSTLQMLVNGIAWQEVPSFYGTGPADRVYIVREQEDGTSVVTFGDGVSGARPPSGTGNVTANYRYGAGAADPPALSVRQLAKPVSGLRNVRNPLAAFGGSDAEAAGATRRLAPRSALLLGRAVSIDDMQVVAAQTPHVIAATAAWAWSPGQQRPLVQIWYIGDSSLESTVRGRLRILADPTVSFAIDPAIGLPTALSLDVEIDSRRRNADVASALTTALTDPVTGLLAPANIGIGTTLFVSALFEWVLAVEGTVAVTAAQWNGTDFPDYGMNAGDGCYFDLSAANAVAVNAHGGIDG